MTSRRNAISTLVGSSLVGASAIATAPASAEADRPPGASRIEESDTKLVLEYDSGRTLKLTYDEALIQEYQPQLILEGVDPQPLAFHGLHAESDQSTLNAVYGFVHYPYQSGASEHDSHLGDHEPIIVWYDQSNGSVERVDYAAYHWFRGSANDGALTYADDAEKRPLLRVDPSYHHYYLPSEDPIAGDQIQLNNLLASIDNWLDAGLEEELALSQPFDPWDMLSRPNWWRETTGNWLDASFMALWYNLGISGADTADPEEVEA